MPGKELRLLALDGGGVRGLSSLMILEQLMQTIDPDHPPKPSEYFDMIGGTSTGGLIAVMLGRLKMTIDECIDAYLSLSDQVFQKKAHRVTIQGKIQGRFDSKKLEEVVKEVVRKRKLLEDTLLKSAEDGACKVFVCATSKETSETVCLTSYKTPHGNNDLLNSATIWEACRATSAASSFFDSIAIGRYGEEFVDGGTGANNPVWELWNQAQAIYGPGPLEDNLDCIVSIGTGVPSLTPFSDDILHIHETLIALATETEQTAERFRRSKAHLDDAGCYFRFNVAHGLEEIGLEESKKKKDIAAATRRYVTSQEVLKQMTACVDRVSKKQFSSKYHIPFSLRGVPVLDRFADRPTDLAGLGQTLLPRRGSCRRQVFVLSGMGGMGKTQLAAQFTRQNHERYSVVFWLDGSSEDSLKQSMASAATRIPAGQIPEAIRTAAMEGGVNLEAVVEGFLNWLSVTDNNCWLLVIDNVDREYRAQHTQPGAYDVTRYFPWADHGSILVTTRLGELEQQGTASKKLQKADDELAEAIFRQWYTRPFDSNQGSDLFRLLDGLPLALTQAAAYMQQSRIGFAQYIYLYTTQWQGLMRSYEEDGIPLPAYQRSIWTTWMVSFEAIREKNSGAADLLLLWALLDNRDLWYGLFDGIREKSILASSPDRSSIQEISKNEVAFNRAIQLLLNYCLVEEMEDLTGYAVHPVVHQWARHIQNDQQRANFAGLAVTIVGCAVPSDSERDFWMLQRRLLGHAERCYQWIVKERCQVPRLQDFNDRKGMSYNEDMEDILDALLGLGNLYRDQGKLEEAETMYQQALRGFEKALGADLVKTYTPALNTCENLARLLLLRDRPGEAMELYQRALAGFRKVLGSSHQRCGQLERAIASIRLPQGTGSLFKQIAKDHQFPYLESDTAGAAIGHTKEKPTSKVRQYFRRFRK